MPDPFSSAWLADDPRATDLFPRAYQSVEDRRRAVERAAERTTAPALVEALDRQAAPLPASDARARNLDALARGGAGVVVTGQQVGLFLGPLFTVYKAASAVVAARALAEETGRPCVPVFWLQTEDHDLAEIDHCQVPGGADGPQRISLGVPDAAASRVPVGQLPLGPGVEAALAALTDALTGPERASTVALLKSAYRPEATMAEAFGRVLGALFAPEGLLVLDPRDPALASLAAPLHRRALREAAPLSAALEERSAALAGAGFAEQVHIRPGSPLSFFSFEGADGPRYRLDPDEADDTWQLVGHRATVTTAELEAHLDEAPARFTTSALLRPLLQDSWLPTAAYVGGPGEISYFAQLPPVYEHFELGMPLIVPRARFRILDERTRSLLDKLRLTVGDLDTPREALLARIAAAENAELDDPASAEARLLQSVAPALSRFGEQCRAVDASLDRAVARADKGVRDAIGRLVATYGRALARREEVEAGRLDRALAQLAPGGAPQERVYSLAWPASLYGARPFVERVLEACQPFSGEPQDLTP